MRRYLAKKYFANAILIMIIPALLLGGEGLDSIILTALLVGILAAIVTYWQFKQRNLWVLYDNLQYSACGYLSIYTIVFEGCSIGLGSLLG